MTDENIDDFLTTAGKIVTGPVTGVVVTALTGNPAAGYAASAAASEVAKRNPVVAGAAGYGATLFAVHAVAGLAGAAIAVTAPVWIPALIIKKVFFPTPKP